MESAAEEGNSTQGGRLPRAIKPPHSADTAPTITLNQATARLQSQHGYPYQYQPRNFLLTPPTHPLLDDPHCPKPTLHEQTPYLHQT